MAKTRLTISLDKELADRIRAYAEQAGMDVSSFLLSGAVHQMSIADQAKAQYVHPDAERRAEGRDEHEPHAADAEQENTWAARSAVGRGA